MEVCLFKASKETYGRAVKQCREWLGLITKYQRDAVVELSQIYQALTGTIVDKNTVSDASGILHSSEHVYIYRFDHYGQVYYGNDRNPWPIGDNTLWPWIAAAREPPRMVRDVWNLIFAKLAPYDILACGKVCRQLRDYAHDSRAWKKFALVSSDWRFYSSIIHVSRESEIVCHFLRLICVPIGYGGGKVSYEMTHKGDRVYQIGDLQYIKARRKRAYRFQAFYMSSTNGFTAREMHSYLMLFLKTCCEPVQTYSQLNSPVKDWNFFKVFTLLSPP